MDVEILSLDGITAWRGLRQLPITPSERSPARLQHDVGKWCTEYTYSAEDSMWGVRVLHNFGRLASPTGDPSDSGSSSPSTNGSRIGVKRVDEEDPVAGGLKGRVSIGAELYFSAKERSAGGSCIAFLQPATANADTYHYF